MMISTILQKNDSQKTYYTDQNRYSIIMTTRTISPQIIVNEKYHLSFMMLNWDTGKISQVTYKLGRNGIKIGYTKTPKNWVYGYGTRDSAAEMTATLVYEDEGTFGSGGLFHNDVYTTIKLKGFKKAVKSNNYNDKWTAIECGEREVVYPMRFVPCRM